LSGLLAGFAIGSDGRVVLLVVMHPVSTAEVARVQASKLALA